MLIYSACSNVSGPNVRPFFEAALRSCFLAFSIASLLFFREHRRRHRHDDSERITCCWRRHWRYNIFKLIVIGQTAANRLPQIILGENTGNFGSIMWATNEDILQFKTKVGNIPYKNTLVLNSGNVGIGTTSHWVN